MAEFPEYQLEKPGPRFTSLLTTNHEDVPKANSHLEVKSIPLFYPNSSVGRSIGARAAPPQRERPSQITHIRIAAPGRSRD